MKKNKKITLIATLALIGAIGVGSTFAYFTDTEEVTNTVEFGHVDISIVEEKFDAATNNDKYFANVVPGQEIIKDPTIVVADKSENAFIRAKISFEGLTDEQAAQLELNGFTFGTDWSKKKTDGYYYYAKEVKAKDKVEFFTKVTIPAEWDNSIADKEFKIIVSAEAIQADNFEALSNGTWDNSIAIKKYEP